MRQQQPRRPSSALQHGGPRPGGEPDRAAGPAADAQGNAALQEQLRAGLLPEQVEAPGAEGGMGEGSGRGPDWGKEVASFNGVPAFSNGSDRRYYERGAYGFMYQCVEYVNRYSVLANGTGNMKGTGNAVDYGGQSRKGFGYTWVKNEPGAPLPEAGDILVFSGGTFGHVAIATAGGPGGVQMIQQNTGKATATLAVSGEPGQTTVAGYGNLKLEGWQHLGAVKPAKPKSNGDGSGTKLTQGGKPASAAGARTVTVKPGDSLWAIAARHLGDGARYRELAKLNGIADPSRISAGQVIELPGAKAPAKPQGSGAGPAEGSGPKKPAAPSAAQRSVTVRPGDTLWAIAARELGDGSRHKELAKLNGIRDPRRLAVGTTLKLPGRR